MWSWLEVYPQHVFRNGRGEKEQMSVGVAQNAVDGKLAVLSDSTRHWAAAFTPGAGTPPRMRCFGYNFAEQWERALEEDPRVRCFITGLERVDRRAVRRVSTACARR